MNRIYKQLLTLIALATINSQISAYEYDLVNMIGDPIVVKIKLRTSDMDSYQIIFPGETVKQVFDGFQIWLCLESIKWAPYDKSKPLKGGLDLVNKVDGRIPKENQETFGKQIAPKYAFRPVKIAMLPNEVFQRTREAATKVLQGIDSFACQTITEVKDFMKMQSGMPNTGGGSGGGSDGGGGSTQPQNKTMQTIEVLEKLDNLVKSVQMVAKKEIPAIPKIPATPDIPAEPAKEAIPAVKDKDGKIITPEIPAHEARPAIPGNPEIPEVPAVPGLPATTSVEKAKIKAQIEALISANVTLLRDVAKIASLDMGKLKNCLSNETAQKTALGIIESTLVRMVNTTTKLDLNSSVVKTSLDMMGGMGDGSGGGGKKCDFGLGQIGEAAGEIAGISICKSREFIIYYQVDEDSIPMYDPMPHPILGDLPALQAITVEGE